MQDHKLKFALSLFHSQPRRTDNGRQRVNNEFTHNKSQWRKLLHKKNKHSPYDNHTPPNQNVISLDFLSEKKDFEGHLNYSVFDKPQEVLATKDITIDDVVQESHNEQSRMGERESRSSSKSSSKKRAHSEIHEAEDATLPQSPRKKSSSSLSHKSESSEGASVVDSVEQALRENLDTTLPILLEQIELNYHQLEYLGGGSNNIVYAFKAFENDLEQDFIIRIPRIDYGDDVFENATVQAGILGYLNRQPSLAGKIPRVVRFDATSDNVINRQYMIQQRIDGESLVKHYFNLYEEEAKSLAKSYADLILDIEKVTFQHAGELTVGIDQLSSSCSGQINVVDWRGIKELKENKCGATRPKNETLYQLLSSRISVALAAEGKNSPKTDGLLVLRRILQDMRELGWFDNYGSNHPTVLMHADLYPQNIMITPPKDEDDDVAITGIIDWDDAIAVPRVLSRRPPHFLWEPRDDEVRGCFGVDPDFYTNEEIRPSEDGVSVKKFFDQYMTSKDARFIEETYGTGLWIRRLAKFVLREWGFNQDLKALEWFEKEWINYWYKIGHSHVDVEGLVLPHHDICDEEFETFRTEMTPESAEIAEDSKTVENPKIVEPVGPVKDREPSQLLQNDQKKPRVGVSTKSRLNSVLHRHKSKPKKIVKAAKSGLESASKAMKVWMGEVMTSLGTHGGPPFECYVWI